MSGESERDEINSPVVQVRTAKGLFILTSYICYALETGKIPIDIFNKPLTIKAGDEVAAVFKANRKVKKGDLDIYGINLRISMLGMCCIVLDSALDGAFGKKPRTYSDSSIDALRAIVYMMRCAFAHNLVLPVWNVKGKYLKSFTIKELGLEMDFNKLNGQALKYEHFGGWNVFFNIVDYCIQQIELKEEESD